MIPASLSQSSIVCNRTAVGIRSSLLEFRAWFSAVEYTGAMLSFYLVKNAWVFWSCGRMFSVSSLEILFEPRFPWFGNWVEARSRLGCEVEYFSSQESAVYP